MDKVWDWRCHRRPDAPTGDGWTGAASSSLWTKVCRGWCTIFKRLYDGLILSGRAVNWSPVLQTAISDPSHHCDIEGELVSREDGSLDDSQPHIVVATTRRRCQRYRDRRPWMTSASPGRHQPGRNPFVDRELATSPTSTWTLNSRHRRGHTRPRPQRSEIKSHQLPMPSILDTKAGSPTPERAIRRHGASRHRVAALSARGPGPRGRRKDPTCTASDTPNAAASRIEPRGWSLQTGPNRWSAAGDVVRNGDTVIHLPKHGTPLKFPGSTTCTGASSRQFLWWGYRIPIWYGPDGEQVRRPDETPRRAGTGSHVGYLVFVGAVAVLLHAGLAGSGGAEKFYPTSVLVGYTICSLGGQNDDVRHLSSWRRRRHHPTAAGARRCRSPTCVSAWADPRRVCQDEQVQGQRHRPAGLGGNVLGPMRCGSR